MENCPIGAAEEFTCSTGIRPAATTSPSARCHHRPAATRPRCTKLCTRRMTGITTGSRSTSRPTLPSGKRSMTVSRERQENSQAVAAKKEKIPGRDGACRIPCERQTATAARTPPGCCSSLHTLCHWPRLGSRSGEEREAHRDCRGPDCCHRASPTSSRRAQAGKCR